ncbi:MAG: murein L,D-transpeptidase family protein [Bacteroidales bacterium]
MLQYFRLNNLLFLLVSAFSIGACSNQNDAALRLKQAHKEKDAIIDKLLKQNHITKTKLQLYLRAFKQEKKLELWAKDNDSISFKLIKTYDICSASGNVGPKRKEGDRQVPEGFYHIDRFNPRSRFHLSLGLNYPNTSDKILSDKNQPGNNIFIHGSCVSVGCLAITDDRIKEVYLFCLLAKMAKQKSIPVSIFPSYLTNSNLSQLKKEFHTETDYIALWDELKTAFDYFNSTKQLPKVKFQKDGRHLIN